MAPLLAALLMTALPAAAELPGVHLGADVATSRWEPRCILHAVANDVADVIGRHRGPEFEARLRAAASAPNLPTVRLESRTPLTTFRAALARQYVDAGQDRAALGADTVEFSNLYALATNEVYVIDTKSFYERLGGGRSLEDSLAHEYVHYIQVRYYGYTAVDLARDHTAEAQAVEHQQTFRDRYVRTGKAPPCP